jgi:hypothetical protein
MSRTMGIPTSRYQVDDLAKWGRLIKSWATHHDYVSRDYPDQPPRSYWLNKTWNDPAPPSPQTSPDTDPNGTPKAWCLPVMTSVNVPDSNGTMVPLPGAIALTVQQFTAAVTAAGVNILNMPKQYKNVIVVQGGEDTIVFRLPPSDTLQSSEDDIVNGFDYLIPAFYNNLYGGQQPYTMPQCPDPTSRGRAAIMELHANRIGEYTLNTCN